MFQCPNGLHHVILDVLATPGENNIFGFFEIRHTDLGRTKYGIKNYDYIRLFLTLRNSPDMSYSRFMTILLINLVNLVI